MGPLAIDLAQIPLDGLGLKLPQPVVELFWELSPEDFVGITSRVKE